MLSKNIITLTKYKINFNTLKFRYLSTNLSEKNEKSERHHRMSGWQIHSYGDLTELQCSDSIRIPVIQNPNDILIKVNAASVNPIDVNMINGYGSKLLNFMRCGELEFPLTLGRDFCGTVAYVGPNDKNYISVGDEVYGVVPVQKPGCHAEYVTVDSNYVIRKSQILNNIESAALLYAGLTAWSGIFISGLFGGFSHFIDCSAPTSCGTNKTVLVLGGTGGVGHMAIQILKAENAKVVTTCSADGVDFVEKLGADHTINYKNEQKQYISEILQYGPYDMILDCAGKGPDYASEIPWQFKNYVTFSSPFLRNVDSNGLQFGLVCNAKDILQNNLKALIKNNKGLVKWGYFIPARNGIKYLSNLVEQRKLRPIVQETYNFNKINEAYKQVLDGHLRGKVVINF